MFRSCTFVALAALFLAVSTPAGFADYGAVSRYADRGIKVAVSYDFQSGNYSIVTRFATPFTGKSRYSIDFGPDERGTEYRLRLFPNGDFAWARRDRGSEWVERDASVLESPPSADRKTLDIAIARTEIGGATSFDFSVVDDGRSSPTWRYPASAAVLRDQAAAARALLRRSDLGQPGWQFLPGDYGARCVSGQPTAVGRTAFNEVDSLSTGASGGVFVYATTLQARHAFSTLHASLIRCYDGFAISNDNLVTGFPTGALAATLHQDSSTVHVLLGYSLVGRGIVLFIENSMGDEPPFTSAQEAGILRLMASRLS